MKSPAQKQDIVIAANIYLLIHQENLGNANYVTRQAAAAAVNSFSPRAHSSLQQKGGRAYRI
jgi:hypothetical protein